LQEVQGPVLLLLAMRSEFLPHLQQQPWFHALPADRLALFSLAPLPDTEFSQVIQGPAKVHSHRTAQAVAVEPALVDRLQLDTKRGADPLPLLALTLHSLYQPQAQHHEVVLSLADYHQSVGGLDGVVAHVIQQALNMVHAAPEPSGTANLNLEPLFTLIASIDPQSEQPARRVARLKEVQALPAALCTVVDRLVACRILVRHVSMGHEPADGEGSLEIAHEAVLRQWPAMADWLVRMREPLLLVHAIHQGEGMWRRSPQGSTLRGNVLRQALEVEWQPGWQALIRPQDHAFLRASQRQARNERVRWLVPVAGSGALLVALGFSARVLGQAENWPERHPKWLPVWWTLGWPVQELNFLPLPDGQFQSGCDPARDSYPDTDCGNLLPASAVRVESGCELGSREVSYEQYDRYVWESGSKAYPKERAGASGQHPVTNVTPADIDGYARWLGQQSKGRYIYRLPTETEWEYAARGGARGLADRGPFPWGAETPTGRAVCRQCGPTAGYSAANDLPAPVGRYEAPEGFFDLVGNVAEWAVSQDGISDYAIRGGGHTAPPAYLRIAATRPLGLNSDQQRQGADDIGFRLCRLPGGKGQTDASRP
jgi:formylglycine-generating enzyme required for sulfatase activity